jgi:hypothetical protein
LMAKLSWKTLAPSVLEVTSMLVSASRTSFDTGIGTAGPIISVRLMPLRSNRSSGNAGRQADAQNASHHGGKFFRAHGAIGVTYAPEKLRVAEILRGQNIKPVNLTDRVLLQLRQCRGLRDKAPANESHGSARRRDECGRFDALITAVGSKQAGLDARELKERL